MDGRIPEPGGVARKCGRLCSPWQPGPQGRALSAAHHLPSPAGKKLMGAPGHRRSDVKVCASAGVWMALGDAPEAGASLLWFKPSVRSGELFSSSHCLGTWVRPCPVARPLPEGHLRMKAGLRMALWVLWGTLKASSPHRQPAPSETSWHGLSVPGWCLEAAGWVPIPSGPPPRHALRQRGSVVPSIRWAPWHISWRTVGPPAVCPRSVSGTPRPPHLSSSCRIASSDARGPRPLVCTPPPAARAPKCLQEPLTTGRQRVGFPQSSRHQHATLSLSPCRYTALLVG